MARWWFCKINLGDTRFLTVTPINSGPRRDIIGTRAYLRFGDIIQVKEMVSGGSYLSQNPLFMQFGAADADHIDLLQLQLPTPL